MGSGVSDGSRQDSGRGMECQKGRLKTFWQFSDDGDCDF
jgi:50S ribosomal protein L15